MSRAASGPGPRGSRRDGPGGDQPDGPADGWGDRERAMLDFERQWWQHAGAKEDAIRTAFALTATDYYRALNAVIDRPAALAHDPLLVRRLRRMRQARRRERSARRVGRSS